MQAKKIELKKFDIFIQLFEKSRFFDFSKFVGSIETLRKMKLNDIFQ